MKEEKSITTTHVVTLKLAPSDLADLEAVSPYIVVDPYAEGYILEVNVKKTFPLPIKWRRNGREIKEWTGQTKVVDDLIISPGIYEAYYEGRRRLAVHAIMRVIRGSARENVDSLGNPPCYSGGAYHDRYKVCICPPGFIGEKCEKACGANKFGLNCDRVCSLPRNNEDKKNLCSGHLFCKPDPYGCSCAPGFKGLDCTELCESGWYGADCKQQCHCLKGGDFCDRITGVCDGGCLAGWGGESCQIKACPPNHYGLYCDNDCACLNGGKCAEDGSCACVDIWTGRFCGEFEPHFVVDKGKHQRGMRSSFNESIEAVVGQTIKLNCTAVGGPEPFLEMEEVIYRSRGESVKRVKYLTTPDLAPGAFSLWHNKSHIIIEMIPETEGLFQYICSATNKYGRKWKYFDINVDKP